MLKVKRDDYYDLNDNEGGFDMNDVNQLFSQIQNRYEEEDKEDDVENKEDDEK